MAANLANLFVNRKQVKMDAPQPTVADVVRKAGHEPESCDVFRLRNEGEEMGEKIELSAILDRTAQHQPFFLRCIPKDRNVGAGSVPSGLEEDVETLRKHGYSVSLHLANARLVYAVFSNFPLPKGKFSKSVTDVLVLVPLPYPDAKIDMFYTEPEVVLASGATPAAADVLESHLGRNWRRFSWHTQRWNPAVDDLVTHVAFVEQRLQEKN